MVSSAPSGWIRRGRIEGRFFELSSGTDRTCLVEPPKQRSLQDSNCSFNLFVKSATGRVVRTLVSSELLRATTHVGTMYSIRPDVNLVAFQSSPPDSYPLTAKLPIRSAKISHDGNNLEVICANFPILYVDSVSCQRKGLINKRKLVDKKKTTWCLTYPSTYLPSQSS